MSLRSYPLTNSVARCGVSLRRTGNIHVFAEFGSLSICYQLLCNKRRVFLSSKSFLFGCGNVFRKFVLSRKDLPFREHLLSHFLVDTLVSQGDY